MTFAHVQYLHLLWLLPALGAAYIYGFARKRRAMNRFATDKLHGFLLPGFSAGRQKVRALLVLLALGLLVIALAGPRWGEKPAEVYRRGVDVMVVLDVSRSMLADDVAPSRLEKARHYVRDLLEAMPGDRVGLVTFAGRSSLACPLTPNYGWFRMALDEAGARSVTKGGSDLAQAIRLAAEKLGERPGNHKAILLITDGEDQDSDPAFAARYAWEDHKVRTFAIGLGDATVGRRIPIETEAGVEYVKEPDGEEHYSKMQPEVLNRIAEAGDGFAVPAGTAEVDMTEFYDRMVANLAPEEYEVQLQDRFVERYQWFAAGALVLLMIEAVMTDRRPGARDVIEPRVAA